MPGNRRTQRVRDQTLRRREEILDAAMATFGSKGYRNGPLTEIAEQVDMTHAGVLHHFGSKNQLLLEVLQHRDDTDVAGLADQRIPGGLEMFRHLVRTAFLNARRAGLVQTYAVLSAESVTDDHPARAFFQERYRELRAEAVEAFEELCAERGIASHAAVRHAAAAIPAAMDGLQVQWLVDPERVDLGEATRYAIEAIVAAVLSPAVATEATPALPPGPGA